MIKGLDTFAEHFDGWQDRYALIGGTALWLLMNEAGLQPRATRDLDIVLCVEVIDPEFVGAFWTFIRAGRYEIRQKSSGEKLFYRFQKPVEAGYPVMLELFSRQPCGISLDDGAHLIPIPAGEDVSSLSAILLDNGYYEFLHRHKRITNGVSIVTEECLVPLKACAWLDLTRRKTAGENIDGKTIRKHRNDVLRLYQLFDPALRVVLPASVRDDLEAFLDAVEPELDVAMLKSLGIKGVSPADILRVIRDVYGVED